MCRIELKFKIGDQEYSTSVVAKSRYFRSLKWRKDIVLLLLDEINDKTKHNVTICPTPAI